MKASWQSDVDSSLMIEKLRWSLRLRMLGSWLWLGMEVAGFVLLLTLAGIQVAMGHYGVAAALTALNVVFVGISFWARLSPLRGADGSMIELVDLAIQRARRSVRFAWAQYLTTAATVGYVVFMYVADIGSPLAAYHDTGRMAAALGLLAMYALGVGVYHRLSLGRLRRFSQLRLEISPPQAA